MHEANGRGAALMELIGILALAALFFIALEARHESPLKDAEEPEHGDWQWPPSERYVGPRGRERLPGGRR